LKTACRFELDTGPAATWSATWFAFRLGR